MLCKLTNIMVFGSVVLYIHRHIVCQMLKCFAAPLTCVAIWFGQNELEREWMEMGTDFVGLRYGWGWGWVIQGYAGVGMKCVRTSEDGNEPCNWCKIWSAVCLM